MALEISTTIGYHQFLMDESHIDDDESDGGQLEGEGSPWNWSANGNDTFEELYEGPEWIVVPLVFGLIFVVGVVGNGTLIFNRGIHSLSLSAMAHSSSLAVHSRHTHLHRPCQQEHAHYAQRPAGQYKVHGQS